MRHNTANARGGVLWDVALRCAQAPFSPADYRGLNGAYVRTSLAAVMLQPRHLTPAGPSPELGRQVRVAALKAALAKREAGAA
jgi:hypothetical protein